MTAIASRRHAPSIDPGYLADRGVLSWLFSLDHKRIAVMQLVGLLAAALVGGTAALALRAEHLDPHAWLLDPARFTRTFTLHGLVMTYLVLVPGIPGTVGSFVLPLQLGAKNLAFPRLNLAAFHLWGLGALLLAVAAHGGGSDAAVTLLPPYSSSASSATGWAVGALGVLAVSAALRAVVLAASVHGLRTAGMTWRRTTPLTWSLYAHSAVTLVSAPVLALTAVLLLAERTFGAGLFDPVLGGDPTLFQHFFWFGAQGTIFASLLPAIGVTTEIFSTFAVRPLASRRSIAIGLVGLSILSVVAWGIHVPTSGHAATITVTFSLLALLGLVPATHVLGTWLVTLAGGVRPAPPLLFALGSALCFSLGVLTGLFLAVPSLAVHLHGTAFVVGHSHLLFGSVGLALLAALYFWWPKLTGGTTTERLGRLSAGLVTAGVLASQLPLIVLGTRGLPRRVASYPVGLAPLEIAAGVGASLLAAGIALTLTHLFLSVRRRPVDANPWGARGLEWETASPPPRANFTSRPSPSGD